MKKKCIFFDRDGVINTLAVETWYVERWQDFHLLPEFPQVLSLVKDAGYEAIIITNQKGIALGSMSAEAVQEIHDRLEKRLKDEHGLAFTDIFVCPHDENACDCRKPKPGMILAAAEKHDIDLESSWMVGDSDRDMIAGRSAGCRTILVGDRETSDHADHKVKDLLELESLLKQILSVE